MSMSYSGDSTYTSIAFNIYVPVSVKCVRKEAWKHIAVLHIGYWLLTNRIRKKEGMVHMYVCNSTYILCTYKQFYKLYYLYCITAVALAVINGQLYSTVHW